MAKNLAGKRGGAAGTLKEGRGFGVVYQEGSEPDRQDPEGWKLSWDYRTRFGRPLQFRLPSGHVVAIQQSPSSCDASVTADDPIDSSVTVWDSALVLAHLLCRHPQTIKGKRVVELGAGTGLLGCVAGGLGARAVVLTDLKGVCLRLTAAASENRTCFEGRVEARPLPWGDAGAAQDVRNNCFAGEAPDVILSTDCVYREGIPDLLVSSIEALMGPKSIALCAVASHKPDVMKEFCDRVASSDTLTMDQVTAAELDPYVKCDAILVYRLRMCAEGEKEKGKPGEKDQGNGGTEKAGKEEGTPGEKDQGTGEKEKGKGNTEEGKQGDTEEGQGGKEKGEMETGQQGAKDKGNGGKEKGGKEKGARGEKEKGTEGDTEKGKGDTEKGTRGEKDTCRGKGGKEKGTRKRGKPEAAGSPGVLSTPTGVPRS